MYNPDLVCDDSIFHVDEDIVQYFSKYRFKVLTNDQFRKIKETFSKPKIEFLGPPSVNEVIMASKSVRNNTGLLKGDSSLSKIQERLTYSTFPLLDLMQKIRSDVQLTKEEILTSLEQSIVLSSSSFASLSSVRCQRFRNVLAPEYASLVNYDSETPSKFLFGDNIADEVEKHSKEQRIIKKISRNSFQQSSRPTPNNQFRTFRSGSNTFNQSTYKHQVHPKRRVVFKRNQHSRFSKVRSLNPLTGRTRLYLKNWKKITQNKSVLDIVKGYKIPFVQKPTQTFHPQTQPTDPIEDLLISSDISHLLEKGAIEEVDMSQLHYSNSLFLVAKRSGGKRPVINLRPLNRFIPNQKFRLESILLLKDILKPNSFLTKIYLKDAFYSIPIAKKSRKYLQFIYHNKLYQFCVIPFGISTAPRVFSKILKPVIALLRTRGISLIIYLDDLLIAAGTYIDCLNHTKQVISLLESLGLRINYEKSIIIPTQKLEFLGFIIDSTSMSLALPVGKIQSIKSSARKLLRTKGTISIRQLSRFIGLCTSAKYAVPQAPLHYRSLQFLRNSVLKGRRYSPLCTI